MNVLLVGLGSIAKKHISALKEIDAEVSIFALRSSMTSKIYEGVHNMFSLSELGSTPLDFAIISTPTAEHKRTLEMLLPLRCPLFIEKPLFHTLDVATLSDKIKNANILTYVACNLRFLECIQFVKQELQKSNKRINEINVYCGSYLPEWRPGTDFRKVYSSLPEAGGGVHIDLIHEIDYLYWLLGNPVQVHQVCRNSSVLNIRAFDYANYCLEYDDYCASVILNYYRRDAKRTLEIVWEDSTWEVDLLKNEILENKKIIYSSPNRIKDTYVAQMRYFVDLLGYSNRKSMNTFFDALEVLKICLNYDTEK